MLWVAWSNWIYRNDLNDDDSIESEDQIKEQDIPHIINLLNRVYINFHYTSDNIFVLFDAMHKPYQSYLNYCNNVFFDDCDGYHAAIYHIFHSNSYGTFLISYIPTDTSKGHTVCGIKGKDKYYVVDYNKIYTGETLDICLNDLSEDRKVDIVVYALIKFDYEANKYKIVSWG